jgi:hypothetical protein
MFGVEYYLIASFASTALAFAWGIPPGIAALWLCSFLHLVGSCRQTEGLRLPLSQNQWILIGRRARSFLNVQS